MCINLVKQNVKSRYSKTTNELLHFCNDSFIEINLR